MSLRILTVTPRSPLFQGGVERHVKEVVWRLSAWGHDMTVMYGDQSRAQRRSVYEGVSMIPIPAWPRNRDWTFAPGLITEMVDSQWDLLHVQSYHTFVPPLAMLRALTLRLPFVLTFHGGGHSSKVRSAARPAQLVALRPLLARAARLVAVARFEIEAYSRILRLPHDRFTYIPNGVDFVSDGGTTDDGTLSGPLLASIGRLERYKGHDRVIDALPEVLAREPTATLVIVGNGPYESALRDQVVRRGLADYVHFTSVPSNDAQAMQTLLARVSLVVLMSSFETHPLVGLEAAAARRRLLVADHAGLGELVRDGLAEGVPITASSSDLAAAILRQLDQPAPSASPSLTSWDDCALNLLALYRAVLDRSPPPQSSRS